MSLSLYSESSDEHRNSLIETEPSQIDTTSLLVENEAPQNMSNENDLKDYKDAS
ncbi:31541_t:CDS:1, partial [Gigaspora margarita]